MSSTVESGKNVSRQETEDNKESKEEKESVRNCSVFVQVKMTNDPLAPKLSKCSFNLWPKKEVRSALFF